MKLIVALMGIATGSACILPARAQEAPTTTPPPSQPPPLEKQTAAPAGLFFVVERLSTVTNSGVACAMPGTKVKLIRAGNPMRVTDGQHEYDAYPYQLTSDISAGRQLKNQTESAQQAATARVTRIINEYQAREKALANGPTEAPTTTESEKQEPTKDPRAERQQKINDLRAKIKAIRQEILDHRPERIPVHYTRRRGMRGGQVINPSDSQFFITERNREIDDLKEQIRKLGGNATFD